MKLCLPFLCSLLLLVGCEKKSVVTGQVMVVTKSNENLELASIPVRLYTEKSFLKASVRAISQFTKDTKIDEEAVKQANAEREQAKEKVNELEARKRTLEEFNRKLQDFVLKTDAKEIRAIETANQQWQETKRKIAALDELLRKQKAVVEIAAAKAEEGQRRRRTELSPAQLTLTFLPPPVSEAKTNAKGRFSVKLSKKGSYVVSAEAPGESKSGGASYIWALHVTLAGAKTDVQLSNDNLER